MKTVAPLLLLTLLASCASNPDARNDNLNAASKKNRLSVYVGKRQLDHGDWEPVDEQLAFGVDYAYVPDAIGFEVGVQGARDSREDAGLDIRGETSEISAGLRVQAGDDVIRPYAGAGVVWLNAELDTDVIDSVDDDSYAAYAHVGITADMGPAFFVGIDARIVFGSSLTLLEETDADYTQLAVLVGFAF